MSDPAEAYVDHARLMQALKEDDPAAMAYAYGRVFAGQLGRLVLSHQLSQARIGTPRGPDLNGDARAYHDGEAAHALWIAEQAGFGRMSVAHLVTADNLEGQGHDGHEPSGGDAGSGGRGGDAGASGGSFGGPDLHPG